MYKKLIISMVVVLALVNISVGAIEKNYRYQIMNDSENQYQIYEIKNELINDFIEVTKGVDENYFDKVLSEYVSKSNNMQYQNGTIIVTLGDGLGNEIKGDLKQNYCSSDTEEVKTKFFLFEIFK